MLSKSILYKTPRNPPLPAPQVLDLHHDYYVPPVWRLHELLESPLTSLTDEKQKSKRIIDGQQTTLLVIHEFHKYTMSHTHQHILSIHSRLHVSAVLAGHHQVFYKRINVECL